MKGEMPDPREINFHFPVPGEDRMEEVQGHSQQGGLPEATA